MKNPGVSTEHMLKTDKPINKRPDIEALRLLAAFGIVWFHSSPFFRDTAYAGLVFFLILSVALSGTPAVSWLSSAKRRAQRLLVPWGVWFVIYCALNAARGSPVIDMNQGALSGVLRGSSSHLWYLPFIFFVLLVVDFLQPRVSARGLGAAAALAAATLLGTSSVWLPALSGVWEPLPQYVHALPGVFIGLFIKNFRLISPWAARSMLLGLLVLSAWRIPMAGIGVPYLLGILAGCVILQPLPEHAWIRLIGKFGKYAYGIYLSHSAALFLIWKIGVTHFLLVPVLAFMVSLGAVSLMHNKFPKLARITV